MMSKTMSSEDTGTDFGEEVVQNEKPTKGKHHRITSFDPDLSSMTYGEIKQQNEIAMSVLSSITEPADTEPPTRVAKRRTAVKVNLATPEDLESVKTGTVVRPEHIVKIFTGNEDVIEVTPEQVGRIKMSKCLRD